jgi:uncharacterized protein
MLMVFVDTSALYAVITENDHNHTRAQSTWATLVTSGTALISTNYVALEATALIQNRIGIAAAQTLHQDMLPLISIEWVEEPTHAAALLALFTANRRTLSLVDCSSFEVMRRRGITRVFAFDEHFREQGFELLP